MDVDAAKQVHKVALADAIDTKVQAWARTGSADDYYRLAKRGPIKPQVVSHLNRFGGAMGPYTDSLLNLRTVEYINASPIDHLPSGHRFVATMCPMRSTFAHFWSMSWEMGSTLIVNLTHEEDKLGSGPSDKRERYWPPMDGASAREMGRWSTRPETVAAEHLPAVPGLSRYTVRLTHARTGEQRLVQLLWYARWIDFADSSMIGTAAFHKNAAHVLALAYIVRAGSLQNWPIVHCSAGVGRTGTFIVLLEALARLDKVGSDLRGLEGLVASAIEAARERRLWMVKSDYEYATIFAALAIHLRGQVRAGAITGSWRPGDHESAGLSSPAVAGSTDPYGRCNDPMKTPESIYGRPHMPPPPS